MAELKIWSALAISMLVLGGIAHGSEVATAIESGDGWLASVSSVDGGWGLQGSMVAAGFSIEALRQDGSRELAEDVAAVLRETPLSAVDAAVQVMASRDAGLVSGLASFRNAGGSYGVAPSELVSTTGFAVLAQALVGVVDSPAISYLQGRQNGDGSWGSGGSAEETGLVLYALLTAGLNDASTEAARGWLVHNQSPLGDWGTVEATAWSLLALHADGTQLAVEAAAGRYLLGLQNSDGGFGRLPGAESEVVVTGLVSWALLQAEIEYAGWQSAVGFLESRRNGEAGWWRLEPAVVATTTVLDTFALLRRSDSVTATAVLWVLQRETPSTDFLARRVGTLARFESLGEADLAELVGLQNEDGGWGAAEGFASTVLDTAIVLDALNGAEYFDTAVLQQATQYLVGAQRGDGSWGLTVADEQGAIWSTALAMQMLKQQRRVFDLEATINQGTAYLQGRQLGDGGWGETGVSTVWQSSLAFIACMQTQFDTAAAVSGLDYVLDTQDSDGSWNQDPFDTALAIRALVESQPNLRIQDRDITFSSPGGVDGDAITISATVHNTGGFAVDNAAVRFYLGDPHAGGVPIGPDQTIAVVEPGASSVVHQFWDTTGLGGDKNLFVLVDPEDAVEEGNEGDNKAVNRFRVSSKPDLTIIGLSALPEHPQIGEQLTFTVLVKNIGESDADNVMLHFYRGDPEEPGNTPSVLGPSTIPAGLVQTYTLHASEGPGVFAYTAISDHDDLVAESNETNNRASISVEVGERVDLMVNAVGFSTRDPSEGDILELWAEVYNANVDAASNVEVLFTMDGTPGYVPDLARLTIPFIGGGQSITTERVLWDTMGQPGDHTAVVTVDPDDQIIETDEINNQQVGRFLVNALPDLVMGDHVITFHVDSSSNPPVGMVPRGTSVVLRCRLSNRGAQDAENVTFRLFRGDPRTDGVQLGEDLIADRIPYKSGPMSGTEPTDQPWLTTVLVANFDTSQLTTGQYAFFGWIDPEDEVLEPNVENNLGFSILEIGNESDLAPKVGSFVVSDPFPEEGDVVTVSGVIENLSITPVDQFSIQVWDGNPLAEGVVVYEHTFPYSSGSPALEGEGEVAFELEWDTDLQVGEHTFHLLIDPADEILELDENNNSTTLAFEVVTATTPDLVVTRNDIAFDPEAVATGDPVTVLARVRNLRRLAVNDVVVRFFSVDRVAGEVQIDSDQVIPTLDPLGNAVVHVPLDTSVLSGSALIVVKADPDDLIAERDETNNVATSLLHLYLPDEARATDLQATVDLTDVYLTWNDPAYPGVAGYDVDRDGLLINPEWQEWARQSTASASSFSVLRQGGEFSDISNDAASSIDGNPMTYWQSNGGELEEWLALELPQPVLLKAVTIAWGRAAGDFDLEVWNGFEWVTAVEVTGNEDSTTYHVLDEAIDTDRVRVRVVDPEGSALLKVSITELRVHSLKPVR